MSERRWPAYEDSDFCGGRISAQIVTGSKREKANVTAYDAEAGDFYYFFLSRISVEVSASNWETVYVSLVAEATKNESQPMANVCGGEEKESKSGDDEGEVSASGIYVAEGSFGGTQDCGIWNASESANV